MEFRYGLRDVKIASWTSENSYGTAIDFGAAQLFEVTIEVEEAELPGDDVIIDTHSKARSVAITMRQGDVSLDVLALITGETISSPAGERSIVFGQTDRPYFAICGKINGTGDGGDTHIFVPKAKLKGALPWRMEYGNYMVPEMNAQGVYEGTTNGFVKVVEHDTAEDIAIPPA